MNYIMLNGNSSSSINGLLIQSLPPISLPQVRTKVETVDGMDGDIVTKLGYNAYDKQFSIGLHGAFDIDEVIAFFASDGNVVFSNEPDKYYKYQVIEQIDFERLLRFRTAFVTFHVQPFKYKLDETPITSTASNLSVTNTGNIFSKPKLTIVGQGDVSVYVDSRQILTLSMGGSENTIIIDSEQLNAYDENGNFKNRSVSGDYSGLYLPIGSSVISWSGGTVSSVTLENYLRWL